MFKAEIELDENFKSKSLDKKKVTIQSFFCQTRESEILLDLKDFLWKALEKYYEEKNAEKDLSRPWLFLTVEPPTNEHLEFVPFFDGAYLKFNYIGMHREIENLIREYNANQEGFIQFKIKEIDAEFDLLKKEDFKKILLINDFLGKLTVRRFHRMLTELQISPVCFDQKMLTCIKLRQNETVKKQKKETGKIVSSFLLTEEEITSLTEISMLYKFQIYKALMPFAENATLQNIIPNDAKTSLDDDFHIENEVDFKIEESKKFEDEIDSLETNRDENS